MEKILFIMLPNVTSATKVNDTSACGVEFPILLR